MPIFTTGSIIFIGSALFAAFAIGSYMLRKRKLRIGDSQKREADVRRLSKHEKKIFTMAKQLFHDQKFESAAQLLESIDMKREAIEILERNGFVPEAAAILLRMKLPDRAGAVYARNKKWKEALKCYLQADQALEAAQCAWNAGQLPQAAELFLKASKKKEAADAFFECGELQKAAKIYSEIGEPQKAIELYIEITSKNSVLTNIVLEKQELQFIEDSVSAGFADPLLCDLLGQHDRLAKVVLNLVNQDKVKAAMDAYARSSKDIGPDLMSKIDYSTHAASRLAELFSQMTNFSYAGIILQKLSKFDAAGESFARAEEFDRAIECFEKAGNKDQATEMRIRMASTDKKKTRPMGSPMQTTPQLNLDAEDSVQVDLNADAQASSSEPDEGATQIFSRAPTVQDDPPSSLPLDLDLGPTPDEKDTPPLKPEGEAFSKSDSLKASKNTPSFQLSDKDEEESEGEKQPTTMEISLDIKLPKVS